MHQDVEETLNHLKFWILTKISKIEISLIINEVSHLKELLPCPRRKYIHYEKYSHIEYSYRAKGICMNNFI